MRVFHVDTEKLQVLFSTIEVENQLESICQRSTSLKKYFMETDNYFEYLSNVGNHYQWISCHYRITPRLCLEYTKMFEAYLPASENYSESISRRSKIAPLWIIIIIIIIIIIMSARTASIELSTPWAYLAGILNRPDLVFLHKGRSNQLPTLFTVRWCPWACNNKKCGISSTKTTLQTIQDFSDLTTKMRQLLG